MIARFAARVLLFLLGGNLVLSLCSAQPAAPVPLRISTSETSKEPFSLVSTNTFHPLKPGPLDGRIAAVTAKMLEEIHYLHPVFDSKVSSQFLDRYLETFDPQHVHFLQSDLAEFERYRTNLDRLTLQIHDTRPACEIFNRYVERLEQHVAYIDELLKHDKFTFETDERIVINRKDMPYPKNLDEAKKLWRERLRYEYLQEKLAKLDAQKKADGKPKLAKTGQGTAGAGTGKQGEAAPEKPKKTEAEEITETLSHRYHRTLHLFIDWDDDDVLQFYLTALAHVYDPHSDYFNHSTLDSFAIQMNLSLFGIGAELTTEDGYCTINRLLPGGPALKSKKIKERDRIIAVAQSNLPPVDVIDMSLSKAVQLIRGPKGTEVRLTVIPADDLGSRKEVTLIRDEISLPDSTAKARLIDLPNNRGENVRLGVIDLPSFYAPFDVSNSRSKTEAHSTTADVARLLTKLKQENVRGVILDLRGNGGGSLEEAIRLTGLFIKEGPVVQVKGFDGSIQDDDAPPSPMTYDGPLVVLTSRFSASASEIVAGALQDYGRALIVGDSSTHGKGTVQSVQPLKEPMMHMFEIPRRWMTNDPGALKVTIKKFYRPSGVSTQLKGVVPDIVLPSIFNESKDVGEAALENPLTCDSIPSAKFEHFNMVEPYVAELRKRSTQRIATDKEYSYIREDIELFKKRQADKTVSLNEKQQLKDKEEAEARAKARDQERLARPELPEKDYDISLQQALLPGLPPPLAKTNLASVKLPGHGAELSGVSTNGPVAAARDNADTTNPDNPDEEKPAAPDAAMTESEHILQDYLLLLPHSNVATAVQ